jgi:hypothetical protein
MSRAVRLLPALVLALAAAPAAANWVASGTFRYQDRAWDQNGFTGTISEMPIRFADIEVRDPNKGGAKGLLAKGKTAADGSFSISVTDSSTRSVNVRVLTTSKNTSDLFVQVNTANNSNPYAVISANVANHNPNTNVNFGILVAAVGGGGEAFNIFDQLVLGADWIKFLTGSRPGSSRLVTVRWSINGGNTGAAYTTGDTIFMRDYAAYDDTVNLHEWGHYAMNNYGSTSNPGGTHFLNDCGQDVRLAYDEGRASAIGCAVRRHHGLPSSNVYLRTAGTPGPGGVQNVFDLEELQQYSCPGSSSEVTVARALWDISDTAATPDQSPGVDDAPHDVLERPDSEVWEGYSPAVRTPVTLESFWDRWFGAAANGFLIEMRSAWGHLGIDYAPDACAPNQTPAESPTIVSNDAPLALTYFSDPDGDGVGVADTDVFRFEATSGITYTIQTSGLLSGCDTRLDLLDTNGSTVLISNNDRATGDKSSLIVWTAPRTDTFYVRSTELSNNVIYGSYDLSLTSP